MTTSNIPTHPDSTESPCLGSVRYASQHTPEASDDHRAVDVALEGPTDIHTWFGLSYANYLVLHRTLMQSMPESWQARMITCLRELDDAFLHIDRDHVAFDVQPVQWRCTSDLSPAELAAAGVLVEETHPTVEGGSTLYFYRGSEIDPDDEVIAVPTRDPIPPYDRGRTLLPRTIHVHG